MSSVLKTCSTVALSGRTEQVVDTSDLSYRFLVRTSAPPPTWTRYLSNARGEPYRKRCCTEYTGAPDWFLDYV
ncbi:hypothetical protein E6P14_01405 (plasmid) [Haloarcula marismortui ATCC 43049]|uniref:Uncharacterized protein n=1 Tax=Haloarcula marismortui (strain ATCC 43049 / DSM 3752 / JCM 8966 / VKM B-1809) TaxID=272569 RepID=A0A4V1ELM9_HALMA|nr:hypothetical protein E6P14_01405 [Haloarcula marismortui ATCC 43049]